MAINYSKLFNRRATPQSQAIPGSGQVRNSAGGYSWEVTDWQRLDRFLILGAEGGTYYIGERDLVKQNHDAIIRCIKENGARVVDRIVEISDSGRAPKNDPAIFALALVTTHGDVAAKTKAFANLSKVCRIGTHLFHFAGYVNAMRGWGRGLRNAVGNWYNAQEPRELALQAIKYQQRDGWSHGDLLRLAHPKEVSREHAAIFRWMLSGQDELGERTVKRKVNCAERTATYAAVGELPALIQAFEQAKAAKGKGEILKLITESNLPREAVPTEWLNDAEVWDALLQKMPMTAMIRNLGKMTSVGLLKPMSAAAKLVVAKLSDQTALKRARVHPMAVLIAEKIYAQGRGDKGSLSWSPVQPIIDALDEAFYATFSNVEPCGKPVLLALDVSGSMGMAKIAGSCLSAREASAAMSLITAATEPDYVIVGFSAAANGHGGQWGGGEPGITPVNISPKMRLAEVVKEIEKIPMGGTDCALPMVWARRQKVNVSGFVTYTDSETWAGNIHPSQALRNYRDQFAADAKAVVVGMTSNDFTIADPKDRGMLDVVGFDTTAPAVIADFIRSD
ncbi:TROVE domain-containing protein [Pedosphaera parvula]|uniref:TROVE domain protein n=1 Tax=Pedosphaera parvula (strain Ellin514) TaxID=320771 RepID=B9XDQ9_PEDPL|nr:TROVE domain-containing protein [Pedosphaera parvula]EEF62205.1 TROVE domain protein [Pedosphaera parvula Ellin514]